MAFPKHSRNESGVALFMVVAAMSVLAILVTEFTYVAQVNSRMAHDGLDQVRAHYAAKTGLKISLLRLKAFQQVNALISGMTGGAGAAAQSLIPKQALERIWSFPLLFPIPTEIPGLLPSQKEELAKFAKASQIPGTFTAVIESESGKLNINSILEPYSAAALSPAASPSAKASASPSPTPSATVSATPSATPSATASFNPQEARQQFQTFLQTLYDQKATQDPDFADQHRDFRVEDFTDSLFEYIDRSYEKKNSGLPEWVAPKRAPLVSLSELHTIAPLDDELFELFAPALTIGLTSGINLNTMQAPTLTALFPNLTEEEIKEFFEFRDSATEDNHFKTEKDFFAYLAKSTSYYTESQLTEVKKELAAKGVRFLVDENVFKITVTAQVNQARRLLEAWVILSDPKQSKSSSSTGGSSLSSTTGATTDSRQETATGMKITFMRTL